MIPDPVVSEEFVSGRGNPRQRGRDRGRTIAALCVATAAVFSLGACSEVDFDGMGGPGGTGDASLVFRVETESGGATDSDGDGNTLRADSLFLVLTQIEFKRDEVDDCVDSTNVNDGDGCAELPIPPPDGNAVQPSVLVLLPGQQDQFPDLPFDVPSGTYDEVQFDFHVLQMGEGVDDQILLNFQELQAGVSVRVDGRYDPLDPDEGPFGFTFLGDPGRELKVPLEQAVTVGQNQTLRITLTIDVLSWFRDPDTGAFFDPVEASVDVPGGGGNPALDRARAADFDANIEQSMEATGAITG